MRGLNNVIKKLEERRVIVNGVFGRGGNNRLGVAAFWWRRDGWRGAEEFLLPTANRALFEKGGEERFFVGTVGKPVDDGDVWLRAVGRDAKCTRAWTSGACNGTVMASRRIPCRDGDGGRHGGLY